MLLEPLWLSWNSSNYISKVFLCFIHPKQIQTLSSNRTFKPTSLLIKTQIGCGTVNCHYWDSIWKKSNTFKSKRKISIWFHDWIQILLNDVPCTWLQLWFLCKKGWVLVIDQIEFVIPQRLHIIKTFMAHAILTQDLMTLVLSMIEDKKLRYILYIYERESWDTWLKRIKETWRFFMLQEEAKHYLKLKVELDEDILSDILLNVIGTFVSRAWKDEFSNHIQSFWYWNI